jgi:hypothetical protein
MLIPLLSASTLVACGDKPDDDDTGGDAADPEVGFVHACVAGPFEDPYSSDAYDSFWEEVVSGTVVSDAAATDALDTPLSCYGTARRVLTLEDAEGGTWRFAYGIDDPADADATPAMRVAAGDPVTVRYRAVLDFGSANGFVVTDDAGLVAAVEAGTWGNALQDGDVPGLTVAVGGAYGEVDTDCGRRVHDALVFAGDARVRLEPYAEGSVTVGGATVTAYAVAATRFEDVQCTDLAGTVSWAVFR